MPKEVQGKTDNGGVFTFCFGSAFEYKALPVYARKKTVNKYTQ